MTFAKIHDAQSKIAKAGGKQLGSLLWWALNGNRITHDRLVDLSTKHSLDERYLPNEIKPTAAFRRAWRHASTKLPKGFMLRPITESADIVVIGLVRERPDEAARDLDYELVTRVAFRKDSHAIEAEVENGVTAEIASLYRHHLALTTADIRAMLIGFLGEAGASLRDSGGVYFVPASFQQTLDGMCAVVNEIGHNATYQLPIVDTPEGKRTLRDVAKRTLDSELVQLQLELDRFDMDKVRKSTLERKLAGFDELRARANLFSRVLSFKANGLNQKISSLQNNLRQQLDGKLDAPNCEMSSRFSSAPDYEPTELVAGVGF